MPADSPDWQAATDVAPILLGEVVAITNQQTGTLNVTLPGTATGIRVVAFYLTYFATNVTVTGATTGITYLNVNINTPHQAVFDIPVSAAIDATVTVSITTNTSNPGPSARALGFIASLGASGVQTVTAQPDQPLPVDVVAGTLAVTPPLFPKVIPATSATLAMTVATINASVVSGTPSVLKAGVGGQTITVYGYEFDISPTTGANIGRYDAILDDTTSATIVGRAELLWQTAVGTGSLRWSRQLPYGLALPVGAGLQVSVPAGSTGPVTVVGAVDFTQG